MESIRLVIRTIDSDLKRKLDGAWGEGGHFCDGTVVPRTPEYG